MSLFSWFSNIPEYNVLLLGETGVGKSTTINALANYVKYKTFDKANLGDFQRMIPAKFVLPDRKTKEPIEFKCVSGDDDARNESFNNEGKSVTQSPSVYAFKFKDKVLRIIDTPGIGDTRGSTVDRENIDQIMAYLNHYKELHAIVIVFKANQNRQTASFSFCITELLNHLHKDATKNLIFCFTFSQSTNFKAGDGFDTVETFLRNELPGVKLKLKSGENCFFIDNESFCFLTAIKNKYNFSRKQERDNHLSWNKSSEQINKMLDQITRVNRPHNLANTISLNSARKFILEMAEPLVRIQTTIQDNMDHIHVQKELHLSLRNSKGSNVNSIEASIEALKYQIADYSEEYEVVQDICAKFAYILVKNSITPVNKFIEPYIVLQINEEKTKIQTIPNYSKDRLKSLENMKDLHQERVQAIQKAINSNGQKTIDLKDIYKYKEELFKLRLTGRKFEKMLEDSSWNKDKIIRIKPEKTLDLTDLTINTDDNNRGGFWRQFWEL